MKVHTHSKKRFVQFRIDDQELYRALKTLSRQPKDRGYSRQQGSVAGVIKKLLLENLAPELKALAEDARSGGGKIANPSGTVQLSPQDSDMERNKASGLPTPPPKPFRASRRTGDTAANKAQLQELSKSFSSRTLRLS